MLVWICIILLSLVWLFLFVKLTKDFLKIKDKLSLLRDQDHELENFIKKLERERANRQISNYAWDKEEKEK